MFNQLQVFLQRVNMAQKWNLGEEEMRLQNYLLSVALTS